MSKKMTRTKRRLVAEKCNCHCAYCGTPLAVYTLMIDHVVPKSDGGSNHIDNLMPVCFRCNSMKGSKNLEQFRLYLSFKKAVPYPLFSQSQIEFLQAKGTFAKLNIVNDHQFFFEKFGVAHGQ